MSAVARHSGLGKAANVAEVSLGLLVSGCCLSLYVCVCVCACVCVWLHRWQREGRGSWRGWWRELSEAPAALVSLRQGGLSAGICTSTPPPPPAFSWLTSPRPPHHPAPWLGTISAQRCLKDDSPWPQMCHFAAKLLCCAPADDYCDKW